MMRYSRRKLASLTGGTRGGGDMIQGEYRREGEKTNRPEEPELL
jgi:hypothetical protein